MKRKAISLLTDIKNVCVNHIREIKWHESLYPKKNLFTFLVTLPFAICLIYYLFVASPRYASSSVITLVQSGTGTDSSIQSMFYGSAQSTMHPLLLIKYLSSYDMLISLNSKVNILSKYSSHGDFFSRLKNKPNQEKFLDYYNSMVNKSYDLDSNSIQISVQAFTPEDSIEILNEVIKIAQKHVNAINKDILANDVVSLEEQLNYQKTRLKEAMSNVMKFQDKKGVLDPKSGLDAEISIINTLKGNLASEETKLLNYNYKYKNKSPEIAEQKKNVNAIKEQLRNQYSKILGDDDAEGSNAEEKLNDLNIEFQWLRTNLEIEEQGYKLILQTFESVMMAKAKDPIQLVSIVKPVIPDYAEYPRKVYILSTLLIALLMMYGVIRMTVTIIKEHKY